MRVTNNMMYATLKDGMSANSENLIRKYEMLSSGKKIMRPSDDPVSLAIAGDYKDIISSLGQYERNIDFAEDYL
ncbi:MAG: hypothetical protein HY880_05700, partial [Deltaproteobacteria bacterium]|nr:hypothetical protein [Deltaproteobacteria bacterium]